MTFWMGVLVGMFLGACLMILIAAYNDIHGRFWLR
jgi:hypothetical protein